MADVFKYRLIGGPEDGKEVEIPIYVEEMSLPHSTMKLLQGKARQESESQFGHPYGKGAVFQRYTCIKHERKDDVFILRHQGTTTDPMADVWEEQ